MQSRLSSTATSFWSRRSLTSQTVAHTELQTFEALRRRGVGFAFADIISWESHETYLMALFSNLQKSPPQNYVKPTLQQVLRADRAVFTKLIQDGTSVRRAADGTLPLNKALMDALNHPDAAYHLMPLPKPASAPPKPDPPRNDGRQHDQWNNYNRYSRWSALGSTSNVMEKATVKEVCVTDGMSCQSLCKEEIMCRQISAIVDSVLDSSSTDAIKLPMGASVQQDGICAHAEDAMHRIQSRSIIHPTQRMRLNSDRAGWATSKVPH